MKYYALPSLACTECNAPLRLSVFEEQHYPKLEKLKSARNGPACDGWCARHEVDASKAEGLERQCPDCAKAEIISGSLLCSCGAWYPIIRGVPRLLPPELRYTLIDYYPAFFSQFEDQLPMFSTNDRKDLNAALEVAGKEDTIHRFSYEWNEFKDYDDDNFAIGIGPIQSDFFQGKRVLDAGCGAGRHAIEASRRGAREVFAMDLSNAVDAAFDNSFEDPSLHVIQGDMFKLPIRRGTLDLIYSLWALPHTHNPPLAFQSMVPYLNETGSIIVYVYSDQRQFAYRTLAFLRSVTTRLPNPTVRAIAFAMGVLDTAFFITPYRLLTSIGPIKPLLDRVTPSHVRLYAPRTFKTCYTDWMDRLFYPYVHYYSRNEVENWLSVGKFTERSVLTLENYGMVVRGTAPVS